MEVICYSQHNISVIQVSPDQSSSIHVILSGGCSSPALYICHTAQ